METTILFRKREHVYFPGLGYEDVIFFLPEVGQVSDVAGGAPAVGGKVADGLEVDGDLGVFPRGGVKPQELLVDRGQGLKE